MLEHAPADRHLVVKDAKCYFDVSAPLLTRLLQSHPRQILKAVDGISFNIGRARTLSLVGESGCGKSTVARMITGLNHVNEGHISLDGVSLTDKRRSAELTAARQRIQMVFQDSYSSLNPRWPVGRIISEPIHARGLLADRRAIQDRVVELLESVGLDAEAATRYPHQFSGGQCQRISIARALAGEPEFLVCDEPTSALDVSVQAQILNLLRSLQRRLRLTMLFISHDLSVVSFISDTVAVMYLGRLCEMADTETLFERPLHPYTRLLWDSVPDLDMTGKQRKTIPAEMPSPITPPSGCTFHPRCPLANDRCRIERPELINHDGTWVACHAVAEGRNTASLSAAAPVPR